MPMYVSLVKDEELKGMVDHTEVIVEDQVLIDYDKDGKALGVEILTPIQKWVPHIVIDDITDKDFE